MKEGDSIIATSSINAFKGNPTLLDYTATKGAVQALMRSFSMALMDQGIRVNAVFVAGLLALMLGWEMRVTHGGSPSMPGVNRPASGGPE